MPDIIRVCIADDNEEFTDFLCGCMAQYPDIEITGTAKNGIETMETLDRTKPDLLLLDIVMPEMDGLQVLEKLNAMGDRPPVFVLAALGDDFMIERAVNLGAEYFFVKPVTFDSIVTRIRSYFGRRN